MAYIEGITMPNEGDMFVQMIVAAMQDAVGENHITQLKAQIAHPKSGKIEQVRIVVMPEKLTHEWPHGLTGKKNG